MSNPKGGLVLTRRVGEAVRLTDRNTTNFFELKILSLQVDSTTIFISYNDTARVVDVPTGCDQELLGGVVQLGRGKHGGQQVRMRFCMPEHINILRTELLK